jgi:hypothetical protein
MAFSVVAQTLRKIIHDTVAFYHATRHYGNQKIRSARTEVTPYQR